jgi:hypothetical protein
VRVVRAGVVALGLLVVACGSDEAGDAAQGANPDGADASVATRTLEVDGTRVDVIIDRPAADEVDVLLLYHGTVNEDRLVLDAAQNTLDGFRQVVDRDDLLLVSVAYPEEDLLMGDNLVHAEAALLWVQRHAAEELGVTIDRVFLAGHSQGGYLVTRLNTLHEVDGVIASAPGPLDLLYRCGLEESGQVEPSPGCGKLAAVYGTTTDDPDAYRARSLLSFTSGQRSDIVFVQGLGDSPIQMRSWPIFREQLEACGDCRERLFVEIEGLGHPALFRDREAQAAVDEFLRERS